MTTDLYYLPPKPVEELIQIAESRKSSLFRHKLFPIFKRNKGDIRRSDGPKLRLIPFWRMKGYHECFYFRGNSYRIELPEDVVAVEVEGRIRDLIGQETADSQRLATLTKWILGRKDPSNPKAFRISDVTELAYLYRESSIFLDADGKEDLEAEAFFEGRIPLEELHGEDLKNKFADAEFGRTSMTKGDLVKMLHEIVVRPPETFTKILTNRFQVTELSQFLMPVYSFTYEWNGQKKQVNVHGYTGGIFP